MASKEKVFPHVVPHGPADLGQTLDEGTAETRAGWFWDDSQGTLLKTQILIWLDYGRAGDQALSSTSQVTLMRFS